MNQGTGRGVGGVLLLVWAAWLAWAAADDLQRAFQTLLTAEHRLAAVDLRMRMHELGGWFRGEPVYRTEANAVYPPAAYAVIRALAGGTELPRARLLFGIHSAALILVACVGVLWATRPKTMVERAVALLLVPGVAAVVPGVANGQLHLVTMVAGVASVLLIARPAPSWGRDLLAAALMVVALTKPTMAVTFFALLWILPGRLRPGLLVTAMYAAVTAYALWFQDESPFLLLTRWVDRAVSGAEYGAYGGGTSNAQSLLARMGIEGWSTMVAVAFVALFGEFALRRRRADVWILLGAAGLVARLCVYHRSYDDVLAVPALVALLRLLWGPTKLPGWLLIGAVVMLVAGWLASAAPESLVGMSSWFQPVQSAVWVGMLAVLWAAAHRPSEPVA